MTTKLKPEDALLFEQATLRAPLDTLKKLQKAAQKTYDYNLGPSSSFTKDLAGLVTEAAAPDEQLKTVEGMLSKMRGLKRKLVDIGTATSATNRILKARTDYLLASPTTLSAPSSSQRTSLQLTDYFLRASPPLRSTAVQLSKEEGIEDLVDLELWDELARAERGLKDGRLDEVLAWTGENRAALRKMKSTLEFTIHLQHFIELCRSRSYLLAIAYAKKHLTASPNSESISAAQLGELSEAMNLLVFGPDTTCIVYRKLYSLDRWKELQVVFRTTFLQLHSLPPLPLLHLSLQAGLASLKTPSCVSPSLALPLNPAASAGHTVECPLCSSSLQRLAQEVPFSHHVNSTIVCRISGKVVEGGGAGESGGGLVALVSRASGEGRVYSKEALTALAAQQVSGKPVDPETGEIFEWEELKKVFIS